MRENKLRRLWQSGAAAVNGWLAIANSFSAETMAHQGWDSLTIDLQHGVVDYQAMVTMLQAISTTDTVPMVRVPWLEPGILMKSLDAGAYGVICPMVNSRLDAQNLVAWTHYAPRGTRSFGPVRAQIYGGADYPQHANETIVAFAMIETAAALDNLDQHPLGRGPRRDLHRALRPVALARLHADARRRRSEGGRGDRPHPRARQGARRCRRHPQRQPGDGAAADRQGIPVRHRELGCAADGGGRAAGDRQDARRARSRSLGHVLSRSFRLSTFEEHT